MAGNDAPATSGYRDERDAAYAQVQALRQQNNELLAESAQLRSENELLRRQLASLGAGPAPGNSNRVPLGVVIGGMLLMLLAGLVAVLLLMKGEPAEPYDPHVPVPSVVPPSTPQPVPLQPPNVPGPPTK